MRKPFGGKKIGLWVYSFLKVSGPVHMDGILQAAGNECSPLSVCKDSDLGILNHHFIDVLNASTHTDH